RNGRDQSADPGGRRSGDRRRPARRGGRVSGGTDWVAGVQALFGGGGLPELRLVRQVAEPPRIDDVDAAARTTLARCLAGVDGRGAPIAVGVGSRGIAGIAVLARATLDELRRAGFDPFVVPAMGSHGGGTAAGQLEVLADYGVTEAAMGVP